MINLGKANHVSATSTAVAVEQAFARIDHEAGVMILMQRAQPHPPAAAELPHGPPIMCLEIIPQLESAASDRRAPRESRTSCLERQNTAERRQIPGKDGGAA